MFHLVGMDPPLISLLDGYYKKKLLKEYSPFSFIINFRIQRMRDDFPREVSVVRFE